MLDQDAPILEEGHLIRFMFFDTCTSVLFYRMVFSPMYNMIWWFIPQYVFGLFKKKKVGINTPIFVQLIVTF